MAPPKKISTMAFEVNKPPKLESFRREDLLEFVRKYKEYVEGFKDHGADQMQPKSIKTMIKSSMLRTICRYKLKKEESSVRSSEIYAWIKKQIELDSSRGRTCSRR